MSDRQRATLAFSHGMDRASGALVGDPSAMADARNVYVRSGKVVLRGGLSGTPYPALAAGTDVCDVFELLATKDILYVIVDRVTRIVSLYRVNPIATPSLQLVGNWGTLDASAVMPPRFSAAEQAGVLFLAHEEPVTSFRLVTLYYTPNVIDTSVGATTTLQADLNGDGTPADVKFRGVYSHVDALWGWGWGTEGTAVDNNRPEVVRVSVSGDPFTFPPENYFLAGVKSDPVIGCVSVADSLAVRKPVSGFRIDGNNPNDYAINPADQLFGAEANRLCIAIGRDAYTWTVSGPRLIMADGSSVDLGLPLELGGPLPADLAAMGATAAGFTVYDPETRVLQFCFPDVVSGSVSKTLVYALSLANPSSPEWSYYELGVLAVCACLVDPEKETPPPVDAYASAVSVADAGIEAGNATRTLTVSWTNNSVHGDEEVQLYTRTVGSSAYMLATSVVVNGLSSQSVTLTGIPDLTDYDVALRFYRSGAVKSGYEDPDPNNWTGGTVAGAKATGGTICATPVLNSAAWVRTGPTAGYIALAFTAADLVGPYLVQRSPTGAGTWTTQATLSAGERSYQSPILAGEVGQTFDFRVLPQRTTTTHTVTGTASNVLTQMAGFAGVPTIIDAASLAADIGGPVLDARLWAQQAAAATLYEVHGRINGGAWILLQSGAVSSPCLDVQTLFAGLLDGPPSSLAVRMRNGLAGVGGATDWADWTAPVSLAMDHTIDVGPNFALGTPAFSAPRNARMATSGFAGHAGARVIVSYTSFSSANPFVITRITADGTTETPIPAAYSGTALGANITIVSQDGFILTQVNGFSCGTVP